MSTATKLLFHVRSDNPEQSCPVEVQGGDVGRSDRRLMWWFMAQTSKQLDRETPSLESPVGHEERSELVMEEPCPELRSPTGPGGIFLFSQDTKIEDRS